MWAKASVWRRLTPDRLPSIPNILHGLWTQTLGQLAQVEALRRYVSAVRIHGAPGQVGRCIERSWHRTALSDAAAHPVDGAGRVLDDETLGFAIPRPAPAHGPAMAR